MEKKLSYYRVDSCQNPRYTKLSQYYAIKPYTYYLIPNFAVINRMSMLKEDMDYYKYYSFERLRYDLKSRYNTFDAKVFTKKLSYFNYSKYCDTVSEG